MTYVIAQPCVDLKDKACIEECPVDCIYEGERSLYIHPDECVDCGACEPVCPVEAIYYEDDVPEQWTDYYKANVEFFDDLGQPRRRREDGRHRQGPPDHRGAAPARTRRVSRQLAAELPDFPWDTLEPFKKVAQAHPDGIVDLSVGTPVDPTPAMVRDALAAAADAPGYPQTWGTPDLREAVAGWFARRRGVPDVDPDGVLPTMGSKELVAWLPTLLGLGADDVVGIPAVAYPTYDVGARLARRDTRWSSTASRPTARRPRPPGRSCSGSTARATPRARSSAPRTSPRSSPGPAPTASWWRRTSATPSSGWSDAPVPSILDPQVCGGSHEGLLAVYSLSKQSNLAGYRAAFVAGDVGAGAPAARGAQARRDDRPVAGPARDGRGPRRRRPRRRAEAAVCGADGPRCERRWSGPGSGSTRPRPGSTCGRPGARTRGRASRGWPTAACSWRRARSTARRAPSTSGWR